MRELVGRKTQRKEGGGVPYNNIIELNNAVT